MNKEIIVDWDNPSDLKKKIHILDGRRRKLLLEIGYEQVTFNSSKLNLTKILPVFNEMYDSVSREYDEIKDSYVYFHCDPTRPIKIREDIKFLFLASKFPNLKFLPFYVGKGKNKRHLDFNRNDSHRKIRNKILRNNKDIESVIIIDKISDSKALNIESVLVDILGLKCYSKHGILVNLDEGREYQNRRISYENPFVEKILKSNGF